MPRLKRLPPDPEFARSPERLERMRETERIVERYRRELEAGRRHARVLVEAARLQRAKDYFARKADDGAT